MTVKELSQLRWLKKEVADIESKLTEDSFINKADRINAEKSIAEKRLEINRLQEFIKNIPDSQTRQSFSLRFEDGLSWLKVAQRLGGNNTDDSVKKRVYRFIDAH